MTKKVESNWPDNVRLKMIEKSEFYQQPQIYQYGYYDGYQEALQRMADNAKGFAEWIESNQWEEYDGEGNWYQPSENKVLSTKQLYNEYLLTNKR